MITQAEWATYKKVERECRLEDLRYTAREQFDTELTDDQLELAYERFENIYECGRTENDCLYSAVEQVIDTKGEN